MRIEKDPESGGKDFDFCANYLLIISNVNAPPPYICGDNFNRS